MNPVEHDQMTASANSKTPRQNLELSFAAQVGVNCALARRDLPRSVVSLSAARIVEAMLGPKDDCAALGALLKPYFARYKTVGSTRTIDWGPGNVLTITKPAKQPRRSSGTKQAALAS